MGYSAPCNIFEKGVRTAMCAERKMEKEYDVLVVGPVSLDHNIDYLGNERSEVGVFHIISISSLVCSFSQ